MPRCGTRAARPGAFTRHHTAPAAVSSNPSTAARTWKPSDAGIPTEGQGHIGIAVAPSNAKRVYAIVDAKAGGLYRSDDAGATWTLISDDKRIYNRGWYFCKVVVDPKNPDIVYVSNTSVYRSINGGKTWTAIKGAPGGDDYHQLWIYPDDPNRMILGSDQGAIVTEDGAQTWSSWYNQPTAQVYNVGDRQPISILGQRFAAGQRPGRCHIAQQSCRDLESRLVAHLCGRRIGQYGTGSSAPRHRCLATGIAVQCRDGRDHECLARTRDDRSSPSHVDAAAGFL